MPAIVSNTGSKSEVREKVDRLVLSAEATFVARRLPAHVAGAPRGERKNHVLW